VATFLGTARTTPAEFMRGRWQVCVKVFAVEIIHARAKCLFRLEAGNKKGSAVGMIWFISSVTVIQARKISHSGRAEWAKGFGKRTADHYWLGAIN